MDSNPLERERGITIFSKNCAVTYTDDGRPGVQDQHRRHARPRRLRRRGRARAQDGRRRAAAGGRVRRPDAADAVRAAARPCNTASSPSWWSTRWTAPTPGPHDVVNEVFDLFVSLEANDHALDFPMIYCLGAAKAGRRWTWRKPNRPAAGVRGDHPARPAAQGRPGRAAADAGDLAGLLRLRRADRHRPGASRARSTQAQPVTVIDRQGQHTRAEGAPGVGVRGAARKQVESRSSRRATSAPWSGWTRWRSATPSPTPEQPGALPIVAIDEPTMSMTFRVNDGPFAGPRRPVRHQPADSATGWRRSCRRTWPCAWSRAQAADEFIVSGRGLMHLGILLENMRREGYEICVGKPQGDLSTRRTARRRSRSRRWPSSAGRLPERGDER